MDPNTQKSASASGKRKQSAPRPRPPGFDTMKAVGNLKEAELREQQAVAIVETIRDSQVELATRDELYAVRDDLRAEINKLRTEMRAEINGLRTEMRTEINKLRTEMRTELNGLRLEMRTEMQEQFATMYWRLLIGIGIIAGIFGTIVTLASGA